MDVKSLFISLPHQIKCFLFYFISYYTYKKRYSGEFNDYLQFFIANNDVSLINGDTSVYITDEVKLLYEIDHQKKIKSFDIVDKTSLKEMLKKSDYYENISFQNSLNTSGSTGVPLLVTMDNDFLKFKFSSIYFFKNIHNCGIDVKAGNFFGQKIFNIKNKNPPFWLHSIFTNQLLFSQYHLNENNIKSYVNAIKKYKLKTIHGYPSVLSIFSEMVQKLNLETEVHEIGLRNITVGSENLSDIQKQIIESTFNCKVLNFYGQTESVVDIFECEKGSMHINESFSFVELIKTNTSGVFKLIGTQLKNSKFPLIRYDTGDLVEYDASFYCDCGRNSRVIKNIIGRDEDFIILNNGTKIGRLDHIFKNAINTIECQIIQNTKGEALFNIVRGKSYSQKDEISLNKSIRDKLGNDFRFEIRYLNFIEKTNNGKLKQVINNIR